MLLHYKAQLYCIGIFVILLFICVGSIKERKKENRLFDLLLFIAIINMCFDIGSNYTVNHLLEVTPIINRVVHIFFFLSMMTLFLIVYKYLETIIENELKRKMNYKILTYMPYIVTSVLSLILPIYYKVEDTGNWSYGPGPNAVYVCVGIYVVLIIRLIIKYNSKISRKNKTAIILALSCELIAALFQLAVPSALTSSLGVALLCICIYSTMANPDAALVRQLKEQTERADAANRAKTDFLAKMSHEIRTPINAVLGMNEMIIRESSEVEIKKYAFDIKSSANNLLSIINEILDSSKIESGKMELSEARYDIGSVLYDIYNMFDIKAKEKGLDLVFEVDRFIPSEYYGDDLRIRQILINLLNNAIKYTPAGVVKVKLTGRREGENEILSFSIKDTGVGIKEEDIEKLFSKYSRIEDSKNRYVEGTGLGINIVIQLLKLMGSELKVDSTYQMGSEFSFDIVQRIENEEVLGDYKDKANSIYDEEENCNQFIAPEAKVLVVDDNATNLKVFKNFVKKTMMKDYYATSGRECIELVKGESFDLIFLDHMMPEMDGIETLKIIRNDKLCDETPIIMLSANAVKGAKERYLKEGFTDYLSKPIMPNKLDKILLKYLSKDLIKEVEGVNVNNKEASEDKKSYEIILPEINDFNFEYALGILGDKGLLMDTLEEFYNVLGQMPNKLNKIYENIQDEECIINYRIEVHGLKSVAETVGALLLSKLARLLEIASNEGDVERIHSMHRILIEEIIKHRELIGEALTKGDKELKPFDKGTVLMYLQMLKGSMENKDYKVADYLFEEICAYEYSEGLKEALDLLKEKIEELDVEGALKEISMIDKQISNCL